MAVGIGGGVQIVRESLESAEVSQPGCVGSGHSHSCRRRALELRREKGTGDGVGGGGRRGVSLRACPGLVLGHQGGLWASDVLLGWVLLSLWPVESAEQRVSGLRSLSLTPPPADVRDGAKWWLVQGPPGGRAGLGFRCFAVWVEDGHLGASSSKQPQLRQKATREMSEPCLPFEATEPKLRSIAGGGGELCSL